MKNQLFENGLTKDLREPLPADANGVHIRAPVSNQHKLHTATAHPPEPIIVKLVKPAGRNE